MLRRNSEVAIFSSSTEDQYCLFRLRKLAKPTVNMTEPLLRNSYYFEQAAKLNTVYFACENLFNNGKCHLT